MQNVNAAFNWFTAAAVYIFWPEILKGKYWIKYNKHTKRSSSTSFFLLISLVAVCSLVPPTCAHALEITNHCAVFVPLRSSSHRRNEYQHSEHRLHLRSKHGKIKPSRPFAFILLLLCGCSLFLPIKPINSTCPQICLWNCFFLNDSPDWLGWWICSSAAGHTAH